MTVLILHHYATSTFSERVRLTMGLKRLTYHSVEIPGALPKPDLLPLTGGYRRTPVLQIGADIYCDTLLILQKIEALHPEPTLYPHGDAGLGRAFAWWADKTVFWAALGTVALAVGGSIPPDLLAERTAFGFPLAPADVKPMRARHLQQGAAHLAFAADMLADGRRFLLGDAPSLADFAVYGPLWLMKHQGGPVAEALLPVAPFAAWFDRIAALGHGQPQPMSAAEALTIARNYTPRAQDFPQGHDPSGLLVGQQVVVRADDTGRDPVMGRLAAASAQEIVLIVQNAAVGDIAIHFPRAGFDVTKAGEPG